MKSKGTIVSLSTRINASKFGYVQINDQQINVN